ncbi:MAG: type IV pilus modification protein PilV [Halopseudomonas sabulinigri]
MRTQRGATLIEVLIAIVVLAIGLLGLAGLQISSLQSNQSSYYRSQATILAYDLTDRMRANRDAALAGSYAVNFPTSSTENTGSGSQAAKDKAEWLNRLATALPEATGKVETTSNLVTISVRWNDTRGAIKASGDTGTKTETFVYRTEI